jgi:hypothetical protein
MSFWLIFGLQAMYRTGFRSSIAWVPSLLDLIIAMLTAFATTFLLIALPLLIIRRIFRGYRVKRQSGQVPKYGSGEPRGWGVYLFVAVSLIALGSWFIGRSDNPLINPSAQQFNQDNLEELLQSFEPDRDQLTESLVEQFADRPGFRAVKALNDLDSSFTEYFAQDPNEGDWETTRLKLADLVLVINQKNKQLSSELAQVSSQTELPSAAPDLKKMRDLSNAVKPWAQARISFNDATTECEKKVGQQAKDACVVRVFDEWEPTLQETIPALQRAYSALSQ